jgi:hypothetical protein
VLLDAELFALAAGAPQSEAMVHDLFASLPS